MGVSGPGGWEPNGAALMGARGIWCRLWGLVWRFGTILGRLWGLGGSYGAPCGGYGAI